MPSSCPSDRFPADRGLNASAPDGRREHVVLREGPPAVLAELQAVLAAGGVAARIAPAAGCSPNG
jgi:hypothetical protein